MFERYPDLELQLQLSDFDPIKAEPCFSSKKLHLPLEKLDIVYVYGVADGYPFLELEEWLEAVSGRHLIFLEDDLQALHRLKTFAWARRLLKHPQVHLKFLHYPQDLSLELCAKQFPCERVAVATLKKKNKFFQSMKLALLRKTVLWNSCTSEALLGHLIHRNILSNFHKLPGSFYVNQTKEAFKGKPAVICGAGPSLGGFIDHLREWQDKALIIACGSSLSALSYFNVKPHIGVAIDPNSREKESLQGCRFRDLPLIYGNRLYSAVFDLFDGPYGYLQSPTGTPLEKAIENELGLSEFDIGTDLGREALSVTTLALSLACFWGCSPIILAGVDLAYAGQEHYTQGVPVHLTKESGETRVGEQLIYRKGAQGKRVATLIKWVMEQETIDAYTQLYPKTTFINATGQGLGFSSIPHRSIKLPATSIDLSKLLSCKTAVSKEQLKNTIQGFQDSFQRCLTLAQKLQEEFEGSGKAVLYEEDLKAEKAYQLTLEPALEALERVFVLNIEIPFSRHKWKFLEEIIRHYLAILV